MQYATIVHKPGKNRALDAPNPSRGSGFIATQAIVKA